MKARIMASAAVVAGLAVTGVANADPVEPHELVPVGPRTYVAGYCGFPIYSEPVRSKNFVLDRTTLADGTEIEETRGQLVRTIFNCNANPGQGRVGFDMWMAQQVGWSTPHLVRLDVIVRDTARKRCVLR